MTQNLPTSRRPWRLVALLLAVPLALSCGDSGMSQIKALVRASFPGVPQMSVDELDRRLDDDPPPLLIDVREPFEYEVSHLPGAIHAQGEDIADVIAQAAPERQIVLYCAVGYRSSASVADLSRLGDLGLHGRIWNLEGSIFEWANSGRPVYRNTDEVNSVHPYSERWSRLLEPQLRPRTPLPTKDVEQGNDND